MLIVIVGACIYMCLRLWETGSIIHFYILCTRLLYLVHALPRVCIEHLDGWMDEHWNSISPICTGKLCKAEIKLVLFPAAQPLADTTHTWSNLREKQASGGQNHCYTNRPGLNPEAQETYVALQFPLLSSCPSFLKCC